MIFAKLLNQHKNPGTSYSILLTRFFFFDKSLNSQATQGLKKKKINYNNVTVQHVVINLVFCLDVAQKCMNGAPNVT